MRALAVVTLVGVAAIPVARRIGSTAIRSPFGRQPAGTQLGPVADDKWGEFSGVTVSRTTFPGEPWAAELLRFQERGTSEPDPRYGWHNTNVFSNGTNASSGHRATLRVPNPDLTIWLFGGSTTYGIGQRDYHTIASDLVRTAARDGLAIKIVNFGVSAYVNWQETLVFEDELRRGHAPDLAVFLDGANDIALGFERETYGRMDARIPATLVTSRRSQRVALASARARGWHETHSAAAEARLTADQYRRGVLRARALGAQYGVPVIHIWQPELRTIAVDAPGVPTVLHNLGLPVDWLRVGQEQVRGAIRLSGVHPLDLTDVFDDARQPVFFDWAHTNEAGARIEAAAMYQRVGPVLRSLHVRARP